MTRQLAGITIAMLAIGWSPAARVTTEQARPARPNIIFIMTDDHAAHAIGAYGSKVNSTPHLDRLAREGALLTNVFATNAICTPSRAAILTGQYSHLNGVTMFNRFDSSRMTVARLLQQGGYHTGMIGKWHLGSDPAGFDRWEILPGQGAYWDPVFYTATGEKTYSGRYATDVITDLALEFVDTRPRDKPFFLMMHHKAPHRPWEPTDEHAAHFAPLRIPEPVTLWDAYDTRTDALRENQQRVAADLTNRDLKIAPLPGLTAEELTKWRLIKPDSVTIDRDGKRVTLTGEALVRWKYQRYMQDYLATVQSVDDSVGRVLASLDKSGLAGNTLVVYTSDQGFFLGDHGLFDKRFMYEESIRMPFLVRWPAGIKPGTRIDAIGLNVDFAPTFLEAAGLPASAEMQGRSLMPVLRDRTPADWRTSMYYRYYHDPGDHNTRGHYGVRTLTHKLIYFWTKNQWELFDLVNDPHELHNLYGQPGQDDLTAKLKAELDRLKRDVRDDDRLANEQFPNGVDGPVARLEGQMKRIALTIIVIGLAIGHLSAQAPRRPNIVVIFADDLGYGDLGAFGAPNIRTPRLDAMAAEGQKWTNYYVQPVCSPSRSALLTGRLPVRNGMFGTPGGTAPKVFRENSAHGLPREEVTVAEILKSAGYATGMVGKWHLGQLPEFLPMRQGFDSWFGLPYSHDMRLTVPRDKGFRTTAYYAPKPEYWDVALMRNEQVIERPVDHRTLTKRYADEAVRFIADNSSGPFFLYLAHSMPHIPLARSAEFVGRSAGGMYGDVIEEIDWSVGRILDALKAAGVERDTLVLFTSDNGPWLPFRDHGGSAGPLKQGKGSTWEGGVRTPAIFWWPGTVTPGVVTDIGSGLDLLATAASLAGAPVPADRVMDSMDLTPALKGTGSGPRNELFYYWDSELRAVRRGKYKAHFITSGAYDDPEPRAVHDPPLLFDLSADPGERHNIAAEHPDILAELINAANAHRKTLVATKPLFDVLLPKH